MATRQKKRCCKLNSKRQKVNWRWSLSNLCHKKKEHVLSNKTSVQTPPHSTTVKLKDSNSFKLSTDLHRLGQCNRKCKVHKVRGCSNTNEHQNRQSLVVVTWQWIPCKSAQVSTWQWAFHIRILTNCKQWHTHGIPHLGISFGSSNIILQFKVNLWNSYKLTTTLLFLSNLVKIVNLKKRAQYNN